MVPTCIKFLLADSTFDSTLLFYYVWCVFDDFVNPADSSHINSLLTMDNKRDATNADLPWPNPPLRPNLDGPPLPGTPSSTSSASTPSATIPATAASSSAPDPTGLAPYASDPSANGAPPFPPMDTSWEHRSHHVFFREQTVHQVFFKVFTYENQRKELWINAVNFKGYSRFREPEQYFYFLIGDR